MKRFFEKFMTKGALFMLLVSLLSIVLGVGDVSCYAANTIAPGVDAGAVVTGDNPLTRQDIEEGSEELLLKSIDQRITKIRPMDSQIDQIARHADAIKIDSVIRKYYSVGSKDIDTTLVNAVTEPASGSATSSATRVNLEVANSDVFEVTSTIRVVGVSGYKKDGTTLSNQDLVLIVVAKDPNGKPVVRAVNGKLIGGTAGSKHLCVPSIPADTKLICMGRAAAELDVQTARFATLPLPEEQYCQKYMMQVGESTWARISKKEVNWEFSDLEEEAVFEMRRGIELSSWWGVKGITVDNNQQYYTTGGIWDMAGCEYQYGIGASDKKITPGEFVELCKYLFTGGKGNKEKILFGGANLIANLAKMNIDKTTGMTNGYLVSEPKEEEIWGLKFKKMSTIFGTLLVIHNEIFDIIGESDNGFVLDYEYLTKATFEAWERMELDQKSLGVSDSKDVVLRETSCLYLRYPKAHCRITPKA